MSDWQGALRRYFRELRKPRPATDKAWNRRLDLSARASLKAGNTARDAGLWLEAAEHYARHLRLKPNAHAIHVQHGNMLMAAGELHLAEAAYRHSIRVCENESAYVQLAANLARQGRRELALQSLAHARRLAPESREVRGAFDAMDSRIALPSRWDMEQGGKLDDLCRAERPVWRLSEYDAFRRHHPIPSAPTQSSCKVRIWIDAANTGPVRLRATIRSLQEQDHSSWEATITGASAMLDHPVCSLVLSDERLSLEAPGDNSETNNAPVLILSAGVVLEPSALSWLLFAINRTGADVAYSDHDYGFSHWRDGLKHLDPVLLAEADPVDLETTAHPPEVVLLKPSAAPHLHNRDAAEVRRTRVQRAAVEGGAAHVPLLLGTVTEVPAFADSAADDDKSSQNGWLDAPWRAVSGQDPVVAFSDRGPRIHVIIPTRNEAGLLADCVESLIRTAGAPENLSFVIINNRSDELETGVLLDRLSNEGAEVLNADEPFNWSKFNNRGAAGRSGHLLFANNDLKMLTQGWDAKLRRHLERPFTGVVGARLLYPDHTIQHGGIAFGVEQSCLTHEGVGVRGETVGPLDRWVRARGAAAVTGAFMAVSTEVFDQAGGFNENLAVGYNDVDFCLRVRALGRMALYAGDIEAIHFESRSRGLNDTRSKVAWDQLERRDLFKVWGDELLRDPTRNPHWCGIDQNPFVGLCQPDAAEVVRHIDQSARPRSWTPMKTPS